MKGLFFLIATLISISFNGLAQHDLNEYLNQINIESIKKHVSILASDSMEGRYSGQIGQKRAARYIASEYSEYGLKAYDPESEHPYYQKFNLYQFQPGTTIMYYNDLIYRTPILLSNRTITDSISGKVIFGGYANEIDLPNLDLHANSLFFLSSSLKQGIAKAKSISDTYAVNTFIIGLPDLKDFNLEVFDRPLSDIRSFRELFYYYYYHLTEYRNREDFKAVFSQHELLFDLKTDSSQELRILFVPEELAWGLFLENFKALQKISKSTKNKTNPELASIKPANFAYRVTDDSQVDSLKTENVIGYLDSEFSDEVIILGAHYDHVGRNLNNEINYGADDNASGTTGILSIAQSLAQAANDGVKINKDILFIAYSAEELGLHGSEYYTRNPLVPLSKTKVVFNLDMIGRDMDDDPKNSNRVFLLSWKGGSKYTKKVQKLNRKYTNLIVDTSPGSYNRDLWSYGSDHYSFTQKEVPSIAYFTALHADYHTPRDTPEKLNYSKMNRIIQLIFLHLMDLTSDKD